MIQNPKFLNKRFKRFIYIWKLLMNSIRQICTTCVLLKKIQTIVTCQKIRVVTYKYFTWIQKNFNKRI